ncbi:TPA: hypothetical protein U0921_000660 [Streptococcus suis]|uniref:hypothetical protein n=1 Tax=Streptococcus suis TaxID=1307 RepID=UPI0004A7F5D4|nr:hypothetical protein [Streptococcus suis]NQI71672.1 hypothetical protein [Streptococcus suis]HEM3172882.1 hypothetical protein [Streptococcus suis]HEM4059011.1 hypothetical protein [Streptococcus suis]HEM6402748.1 hypothetical protein [Streptococcus suis]
MKKLHLKLSSKAHARLTKYIEEQYTVLETTRSRDGTLEMTIRSRSEKPPEVEETLVNEYLAWKKLKLENPSAGTWYHVRHGEPYGLSGWQVKRILEKAGVYDPSLQNGTHYKIKNKES